jgi:hypothetical protein
VPEEITASLEARGGDRSAAPGDQNPSQLSIQVKVETCRGALGVAAGLPKPI